MSGKPEFAITSASLAPVNFHPHLLLALQVPPPPASCSPAPCRISISLTLSDQLFLDPAELPHGLSISPNDVLDKWHIQPVVVDIERPVLVNEWTSSNGWEGLQEVTFDLIDTATHKGGSQNLRLDIPLHARYLQPNPSGYEHVRLLSGESTGCLKAAWSGSSMTDWSTQSCLPVSSLGIRLPTGRPAHQPLVELGTVAAMWLGFAWLAYKLFRLRRRLSPSPQSSQVKAKVS